MSSDKLENIYKLLTEHNFDANKNVPDEFKCGKCRKILIEACQTRCGCRFCRSCVDEMMNNGCQFCPGITSDCKIGLLSTVVNDYRANNQISKQIMKCPEEMCSFECELLEMSEHLRICGKRSTVCPFHKLGCEKRKMTNEKLIEHFQLENYNHNKALIDLIDNIKNEIEELREKELKNHDEINKMKIELQSKDEKLESINIEMNLLKIEKLEMEKRMKNFEDILKNEIIKLKLKHEKELQSIKVEKNEFNDKIPIECRNILYEIDEVDPQSNDKTELVKESELAETKGILQTNYDNKFDNGKSINENDRKSIIEEIRLEMMEVFKQTFSKSITDMKFESRMNQLEVYVDNKTNGIYELLINSQDYLKNLKRIIRSEYFYTRMHPYKMRLGIRHKLTKHSNDELQICLYICDDLINQHLSFPFKAYVTMRIINKNKRELCKSITKYCQIKKPENNSFTWSDNFNYSVSELTENGILESNSFVVQCCVDLKSL